MSEIGDLRSADKAGAPIRPGQLALYVKALNCERPCEACGSTDMTMWPEPNAETHRGMVVLACDNCNALRTFLRPPIVAWLRSARHA